MLVYEKFSLILEHWKIFTPAVSQGMFCLEVCNSISVFGLTWLLASRSLMFHKIEVSLCCQSTHKKKRFGTCLYIHCHIFFYSLKLGWPTFSFPEGQIEIFKAINDRIENWKTFFFRTINRKYVFHDFSCCSVVSMLDTICLPQYTLWLENQRWTKGSVKFWKNNDLKI